MSQLLSDRVHNCQHCSCLEDRDVNAAKVNLQWGLGTDLDTAKRGSQASTPTATGGWKQVWEGKRRNHLWRKLLIVVHEL